MPKTWPEYVFKLIRIEAAIFTKPIYQKHSKSICLQQIFKSNFFCFRSFSDCIL